MAKNKKKKGSSAPAGNAAISPEKYIRTKARTLPLGKCYITPEWRDCGLAMVVVTRIRPSGNIVAGVYLVDIFCMGVKDAFFFHNLTQEEFRERLDSLYMHRPPLEIPYVEAHNLIYGAIEFAEEAGLEPTPDFNTPEYILQEDTDDIPLIEYEYGRNGIHYLVCGPSGREKRLIPQLRERLGEKFEFVYNLGFDSDDFDDECGYVENYSYQYPEYPAELVVKHRFIADKLLAPRSSVAPESFAEEVFALPPDEAAADLAAIIFYEIGRSYDIINRDCFSSEVANDAILNAVNLLACIDSAEALPALLEIVRMNDAFYDCQLGDIGAEHLPQAIWRASAGNLAPLEDYLAEEGLNTWMRLKVVEAFTYAALYTPGAYPEVIEAYRRLITRMVERYNEGDEPDPSFAGCVVVGLLNIDCTPLLPEIEALFGTHCVDYGAAGDLAEVKARIARRDFRQTAFGLMTYRQMVARLSD